MDPSIKIKQQQQQKKRKQIAKFISAEFIYNKTSNNNVLNHKFKTKFKFFWYTEIMLLPGNNMFKVNYRSAGTKCEICSKLTIKIPELNFEHISHLVLVFL